MITKMRLKILHSCSMLSAYQDSIVWKIAETGFQVFVMAFMNRAVRYIQGIAGIYHYEVVCSFFYLLRLWLGVGVKIVEHRSRP